MLNTNLFNSVVRFVREYNYSGDLLSKTFTDYISNHYRKCFFQKTVLSDQEESKSKGINNLFKSNAVNIEADKSKECGFIVTVTTPQGCSNHELTERYNELKYVILPPRLLTAYMNDLNNEFVLRFNKTPFVTNKENNRIGWNKKILYLEDIDNFIFIEEN